MFEDVWEPLQSPWIIPAAVAIIAFVVLPSIYFRWLNRTLKRAAHQLERSDFAAAQASYALLDRRSRLGTLGKTRRIYQFLVAQGNAVCHEALGEHSAAIKQGERAIDLARRGCSQPGFVIASSYVRLAAAHSRCGQIDRRDHVVDDLQTYVAHLPPNEVEACLDQVRQQAIDDRTATDPDFSRKLLHWVLTTAESQTPGLTSLAGLARIGLGRVEIIAGQYDIAREYLGQALGDYSRPADTTIEHEGWLAMGELSLVTHDLKHYAEYYRKAVDSFRRTHRSELNNDLIQWSVLQLQLAAALNQYGDHAAAFDEATAGYQRLCERLPAGDTNRMQLAIIYVGAQRLAGNYDEYDQVVGQFEQTPPEVLRSRGTLLPLTRMLRGLYYFDCQQYERALPYLQEASELMRAMVGDDAQTVMETESLYASALIEAGELAKADEIIQRGNEMLQAERTLSLTLRSDLIVLNAELAIAQQDFSKAKGFLRKAADELNGVVHPNCRSLAWIDELMGVIAAGQGNHRAADECYARSDRIRLVSSTPMHPRRCRLLRRWARTLTGLGRNDEARTFREEADEIEVRWAGSQ